MKNLYFFQVNYSYGESLHLPYTAGVLSAYALDDDYLKKHLELKKIFYLREKPEIALPKIENPFVVAFSTYMWNYQYNIYLAKAIKERFPECITIFGGHSIPPGSSFLEECPYADFAIHSEGEVAFKRILLSLFSKDDYKTIDGISYRDGNKVITTKPALIPNDKYIDYPSPYLKGYFDSILEENKDIIMLGLIETSRGCPYSCAYCDWSNMKSKIRKVPMEKVRAEILWMFEHNIKGFGTADSNFGIFERDEEIVDYIIELNKKYGLVRGFQTSYAKNSNERIFRIGKKLNDNKINRGITLSFQSMSPIALEIIGRKNISIESYKELMKMYNKAGIGTYTELILGLPGETYESFRDGLDELLNMGQHNSIYIHNCECLPCSIMAQPEYMEKYKIGTSQILLNQPHIEEFDDEIPEYSSLVTSTFSMSQEDWIKTNLYSFAVQCFHHYGISIFLSIYLHYEKNFSYKDIYETILEKSNDSKYKILYKTFSFVKKKLAEIISNKSNSSFTITDERFGTTRWCFEEYIFLSFVYEYDEFFEEVKSIFSEFFDINDDIFMSLSEFQKQMLKLPFEEEKNIYCKYDYVDYFKNIYAGNKINLAAKENTVHVKLRPFNNWIEYAKVMAWYGKKDARSICIKEANVLYYGENI